MSATLSKTLYVIVAVACLVHLAPVFDEVSVDDSAVQRLGGSIQVLVGRGGERLTDGSSLFQPPV